MRSIANRALALALVLLSPVAAAQSTLGELLDAGARRLTVEAFGVEVVQHTVVGSTATGASIEIIYSANGQIVGIGTNPLIPETARTSRISVGGDWKFDDAERVCTAMKVVEAYGPTTVLPPRCQFWFKLGDAYFLADSDTDRRAKVLRRTLKQ